MRHNIHLESERLRLMPLDKSQIETIRVWRNQENISCWFCNQQVISAEQQQEWYQAYLKEDGNYIFIIQEKGSGKDIGMLSLYNFSEDKKEAEFGRFLIGEASARGQHYGREALNMICEYAGVSMKLTRLVLEVFQDNQVAYRLYKECGFSEITKERWNERVLIKMERRFYEDS